MAPARRVHRRGCPRTGELGITVGIAVGILMVARPLNSDQRFGSNDAPAVRPLQPAVIGQ
jgi:UDP-N-acetylmuramyl pentapeptide phosphotransferase/UDP-N-acetylglucosamine-1-phosphate transferase